MTTKHPSQADSSSSPMPARFLSCNGWVRRKWDDPVLSLESLKWGGGASPTKMEDATETQTPLHLKDNRNRRQDVSSLGHEF